MLGGDALSIVITFFSASLCHPPAASASRQRDGADLIASELFCRPAQRSEAGLHALSRSRFRTPGDSPNIRRAARMRIYRHAKRRRWGAAPKIRAGVAVRGASPRDGAPALGGVSSRIRRPTGRARGAAGGAVAEGAARNRGEQAYCSASPPRRSVGGTP